MGCGSSHSAVAVIDNDNMKNNNNVPVKTTLEKTQSNTELFKASSSKTSLNKNQEKEQKQNIKNQKDSLPLSCTLISLISVKDKNNNKNIKVRASLQSLQNENRNISTAGSAKSSDSGVYDEGDRLSSAKSQSSVANSTKPPSGKTSSSARQRLLRIDDKVLEPTEKDDGNASFNVVERPKTRLGNVAFDLLLDTPETGNAKKRPDLLPALEGKRKKRSSSKKLKTKEEIDRKMKEVEERRKIQELEKQMKAKQFQSLTVFTTVQPFKIEDEDEEEEEEANTRIALENKDLI